MTHLGDSSQQEAPRNIRCSQHRVEFHDCFRRHWPAAYRWEAGTFDADVVEFERWAGVHAPIYRGET